MKKYIKGNYKRSIYENNGYVIGLFKLKETNDELMKIYVNKTITFTGMFHELNLDDLYCFYGDTIEHPRYGLQFQVTEYERVKPEDKDGLISFLSSDLFKGVGPSLAKSIVDTLGENVLEEILKDESCLLLVPKMTFKKAHKIYEALTKYEESHQVIVYLNELGFNMKDSLLIYNYYKNNTIINLEHNPYNLIDDVGISFNKIDEIANKFNIDNNDPRRIKACIIYIIKSYIYKTGDTYMEYDDIAIKTLNYLNITLEQVTFDYLLNELIKENKLSLYDNKYYLKEMYDAEINISKTLNYLINKKNNKYKNIDSRIIELEKENNIIYNDKQKEAIKQALENNVTIITGGPGTGKTTIIKTIVDIYMNINNLNMDLAKERIALLAPTGRASKRLSESTLIPASTIHRFLKWNMETGEFGVNEYDKALHHLIIIDEVSMIDINLLDNLFKGLTNNIKLVLVGDHNQLPSVGPGNILKDLINSQLIPTIYLETLYRQDETSYIPILANEIKNNNLNNFLDTKSDYTFLKCNSISIRENVKKIVKQLIDKNYDYKRLQLMAPMYMGVNGIDNLNKELQEVFNPFDNNKNEIKYNDIIYRENDKVLQLINNPEDNVYNGDIGIIKNILKIDKKTFIYIDFDGNLVKYESKDLNKITHAFIISIHKSQGSEFDTVLMVVCNSYKKMLYRKLIYTGVTRAKKKLIIIGEPDSFMYAISNELEIDRKTNLINQMNNFNK